MLDPAAVREKLHELEARDRKGRAHGAAYHGYQLNPPLPEARVRAFEEKRRVSLPTDYRTFLTQLGNGGAGPAYGVLPLDLTDDEESYRDSALVGDIAAPFQHDGPWNMTPSFWEQEPDWLVERPQEDEDRLMEGWGRQLELHYWVPTIMGGAIPICHLGCALREWLVITGDRKGEVWADHRADERGIWPLTGAEGQALTFATWYTSWLDEALSKAPPPVFVASRALAAADDQAGRAIP